MTYRIGIDAGGTKVAYGLFDEGGALVDRYQHPTPADADGPAFSDLLIDSIDGMMKKNGYDDADVNLDEELQEECVSYDNEIIDFYFDNDKLVSVNFGVILGPNGEIIK